MILGTAMLFHKKRPTQAQSFFEYTLGMIAAALLMFGMIRVFIWVGMDQVQRLRAHDRTLHEDIIMGGCGGSASCPLRQIRPVFYKPDGFDTAVDSDIYGNVQLRFPEYTH